MKYLLFFILTISALFGADSPFKTQFVSKDNGVEFSIKIEKGVHIYKKSFKVLGNGISIKDKIVFPKTSKDMFGDDVFTDEIKIFIPLKNQNIKITYQGCSDSRCYVPKTVEYKTKRVDVSKSDDKIGELLKNGSIFAILGSFFLFGLLLSLTPCIFPMIPILSGLIVKNSKNSFFISVIYVLSMSITYTIAGVLAGLFGENIQTLFQNPYIITIFSLVFVALAFSMFGFFEIGLPSSIQTKLNKKSEEANQKGGIIGIVIMGILSALIVGPCVAPPLAGALIYIGQTGDAFLGGVALFVMSIGMGIPLLLIGLGAGKFMPKAGGWMMTVNKIFGVIMLGVAIWMISRVIPDSVTMILWAILLIGTALYLEPFSKMNNFREVIIKTFGFITLLYGILLFIGGNLGATNIFQPLETLSSTKKESLNWEKIEILDELNKNIKTNQKIVVDFTAKWCVACKEYENSTFKDAKVIDLLKKYKLLKVDVTQNSLEDKKIMKKFEVQGPPTILIFENGKLVKKIVGFKESEKFLSFF